jgi:DNA-binding XRE family transcriptional regulator
VGLSPIRATAARHGLYDLGLFAGTGVLDKVPDEDDAIGADVGALKAGVMRLYGVVMLFAGWVRAACARLTSGHRVHSLWSVPRGCARSAGASLYVTCIVPLRSQKVNIMPLFIGTFLWYASATMEYGSLQPVPRLRELRQDRGLTQEELSVLSGVPRRTIARHESEPGMRLRREARMKLVRALKVRPEELG